MSPYKSASLRKKKKQGFNLASIQLPVAVFSYQINTKCCIESATCCGMESRFSEHGINAEHCMESRTKGNGGKCSLTADAMPDRVGIPYNSLCELMPYQALRSWIKITASFEAVIFWWTIKDSEQRLAAVAAHHLWAREGNCRVRGNLRPRKVRFTSWPQKKRRA